MKIGYLGAGSWGFCLSSLLAGKGYDVICWTQNEERKELLNRMKEHPSLPGIKCPSSILFTTSMEEVLQEADVLVESVTAKGLRPVLESLKKHSVENIPFILTSKGIEQKTGMLLPEVVLDVLGKEHKKNIGLLSGPSFAHDVLRGLPTSVVASSFDKKLRTLTLDLFTTPFFRVYPNEDIIGVCYGGALKNIIAIACGIAHGLDLGASSIAALITRGLHEMKKLAVSLGAEKETLNGLSGMGDLCLTCNSPLSRNFRFGLFLAKGEKPKEAEDHIHMVVEGAYTCVSALELAKKNRVLMPITEAVFKIIHESLHPADAAKILMQREIKEEHL